MIVHLIRHGDTEATERRLYYGSTDIPVSPKGYERLEQLRAMGGYPAADGLRIYTSGMLRTEQTLAALYGPAEHTALPEFREMNFGEFEMRGYEELKEMPEFVAWCSGDNNANLCPGGESGEIFERRVRKQFDQLLERGEDCLLVVHGGVISCILERFFPDEHKNRYDWQPEPGKGYTLDFSGTEISRRDLPEPPCWAGKNYAFFQNRSCEFFPCHETSRTEDFNCMFCYCPLYALGEDCGGNFVYLSNGRKDCSNCLIPHMRENYGRILDRYPQLCRLAARKAE